MGHGGTAVVGASLAGLRSVEELRGQGFDGRIVVIGEEVYAPYDRPPLSKAFLAGTLPAEDLSLSDEDFGAEWHLGVRAERIDPSTGSIHLSTGEVLRTDGVVIATYMEQLFARRPMRTVQDIRNATVEAGRRRIRPCLMTAFTTFAALLPVMLATGRGADVARAMALPVFFGMFIELVSLFVVPVLYCGYMEMKLNLAPQELALAQSV